MSNKDDRKKAVPLGTFASTLKPPPPPPPSGAVVAKAEPLAMPLLVTDTPTGTTPGMTTTPLDGSALAVSQVPDLTDLAERASSVVELQPVRASEPAPTPSKGEPERKRVRTLLGVMPPSAAIENAGAEKYPSPPKWRRAAREDEPTTRNPVEAVPVAKIELKPNPKLAPLAGKGEANISDAIQQMLDEQTAVTLEVEEEISANMRNDARAEPVSAPPAPPVSSAIALPTPSASNDDAVHDLALEAEAQQLPDSIPPSAGLAPVSSGRPPAPPAAAFTVSGRPPATVTPIGSARPPTPPTAAGAVATVPTIEVAADAAIPTPSRASLPVLVPNHISEARKQRGDDETVRTRVRTPRSGFGENDAFEELPSSVAPAEVGMTRGAARHDDAAPVLGVMMVAAMAVLAIGGWLFTAGGYQRASSLPPTAAAAIAPASPAVAAPAPSPTAPSVAPAPTAVALAEPAPLQETSMPDLPPPPSATREPSDARMVHPARGAVVPKRAPAAAPTRSASQPLFKITKSEATPSAEPQPERPQNLPDVPTRDDVLSRLEALRPTVKACATGRSGIAELDITIANTGVITNVLVGGDFAGTPQGSCIARSVRQAHFPPFNKERFRLLFPYSI